MANEWVSHLDGDGFSVWNVGIEVQKHCVENHLNAVAVFVECGHRPKVDMEVSQVQAIPERDGNVPSSDAICACHLKGALFC